MIAKMRFGENKKVRAAPDGERRGEQMNKLK